MYVKCLINSDQPFACCLNGSPWHFSCNLSIMCWKNLAMLDWCLTNACGVRQNEILFCNFYSQRRHFATHNDVDLVVIGSGPGGYVGAIKVKLFFCLLFFGF